jgi:hypothetical protein
MAGIEHFTPHSRIDILRWRAAHGGLKEAPSTSG